MAEFTIKWPNGAEVTFNGDVSFQDLQEFLDREEPPAALRGSGSGQSGASGSNAGGEQDVQDVSLDPFALQAQFDQVNARNDIERVTVIAFVARQAGLPGVDSDLAQSIFRELALAMPGNWRSTFSNAATRGYLVNEGRGVYRPTAAGENFARLGQRRPSAAARRRRRATESAPDVGGEPD